MKELKASEFPALQRVFSGYLHEDVLDEYGTPAAALRAFRQDANAAERLRFRTEARWFLKQTTLLDLKEVRALLSRLGCRWMPPSRKAFALLAEAANLPADDRNVVVPTRWQAAEERSPN